MNKFLKNCFEFELVLKNPGSTKIRTAIKEITRTNFSRLIA